MRGSRQLEMLAEIRAEMGNVRAAWQWAVQTGNLEAVGQAVEALFLFYVFQSWVQELRVILEPTGDRLGWLVDEAEPQPGRLKGRLLMFYSRVQGFMAYIAEARTPAQQSLELLRQYGLPHDKGQALVILVYVLNLQGDVTQAKRYSSEALRLFQSGDDFWHLTFATGNRGIIVASEGEAGWIEAEHYLQLAEHYTQEVGNPWLLTRIQHLLGELYLRQGKLPAARQRFQIGLALAQQSHLRWDEKFNLLHLGQIAQQLGELQQARQYYEESILASREIGERYDLAKAYYQLGRVYQAEGALQQAQQQLQTSLALRREIEDRPGIAASLEALAEVATAMEQADAVQQHQAEAQQVQMPLPAEERQG